VERTVGHVLEDGILGGGDERWLRKYNIHNLDTQMNISCSFNPRTGFCGFCHTCKGEPHKATQGRDGEALAFVVSDQSFPANVPTIGEGECLRVMRVEDGSVHEIAEAFLDLVKRKMERPGSLGMIGSLTHADSEGRHGFLCCRVVQGQGQDHEGAGRRASGAVVSVPLRRGCGAALGPLLGGVHGLVR
jgi:hypothetical protein